MKKNILLYVILMTALLAGCARPAPVPQPEDGFSAELLSTGKSDCAIIRMDGLVIVNDTADSDDADAISSELETDGVTRIDYLILSHYDKDHIGSAAALIDGFEVGTVLCPD